MAAFPDYFLTVMPPLPHKGGISGFFSTSNATTATQRRHFPDYFLPVMLPTSLMAAFLDYFLSVLPPTLQTATLQMAAIANDMLPAVMLPTLKMAAFGNYTLPAMPLTAQKWRHLRKICYQ